MPYTPMEEKDVSHTRRRFLQSVAWGTGVIALDRSSAHPLAASEGAGEKDKAAASITLRLFAHGTEFEETVIYRPAKRPGYSSWVAPWRGPDGSLFLSFIEKRRHANSLYRPIPLDFWEAMSVPIKYQASFLAVADVLTESVVFRSQDEAKSWKEVGRSATNYMNLFGYMSLPDGSIIRGVDTGYLSYYANEPIFCIIQKSTDMGNTWKDFAVVCEDVSFYPYRLMALRDGAIVLLGGYQDSFGPGRATPYRNYSPGNIRLNFQAAIYYSYDQGASWTGPVPILSGVYAPEPDWVELPSGDLLVINSNVQTGANTREIIKRQGKQFIPMPVFDIVSGSVPETFLVTKDNLLVGTRRGGIYCCSNDLGSTWYEIGNLPKSLYQPRIVQLTDGRLCNFFHRGGDNVVGEVDQYIGQHVFRLEAIPFTDLSISCLAPAKSSGFGQEFRSRCAMDRPVHPAPAQEGPIGRIDDGLRLLRCNVSLDDLNLRAADHCFHILLLLLTASAQPARSALPSS